MGGKAIALIEKGKCKKLALASKGAVGSAVSLASAESQAVGVPFAVLGLMSGKNLTAGEVLLFESSAITITSKTRKTVVSKALQGDYQKVFQAVESAAGKDEVVVSAEGLLIATPNSKTTMVLTKLGGSSKVSHVKSVLKGSKLTVKALKKTPVVKWSALKSLIGGEKMAVTDREDFNELDAESKQAVRELAELFESEGVDLGEVSLSLDELDQELENLPVVVVPDADTIPEEHLLANVALCRGVVLTTINQIQAEIRSQRKQIQSSLLREAGGLPNNPDHAGALRDMAQKALPYLAAGVLGSLDTISAKAQSDNLPGAGLVTAIEKSLTEDAWLRVLVKHGFAVATLGLTPLLRGLEDAVASLSAAAEA